MEISIDSCFGRECNEYLIIAQADKYYMANSIDTSVVKNLKRLYCVQKKFKQRMETSVDPFWQKM